MDGRGTNPKEAREKKRAGYRKVLSVLMVVALFVCGYIYCDRLFVNKRSMQKYAQLFDENEKDFDVLFLGSSHVINGVSPLDLFHDYGIPSFNLSMHSNFLKSGYYLLKETLEIFQREGRHLPKLVVLDVYTGDESIGDLHNAWDSFPLGRTKVQMARGLANDEDYIGLVMPFSLYHSRWKELQKNDFLPDINQLYGAEPKYGVSYSGSEVITDPNDRKEIPEDKLSYVDKTKRLCDSYGITLVLIHIPYSWDPDRQREANSFYGYAEENGLCFVNYMNEDLGLDLDIDFYNMGHLNPAGMRLMTKELGELLQEMGLEDQRQNACGKDWEKEYDQFIDRRAEDLKTITDAKTYLMSLQDPDLSSKIWVKKAMLEDIQIAKLLRRLEEQGEQIVIVEDKEELSSLDGTISDCDLYCTVYKKEDLEHPVDSGGFVREERFDRKSG